MKYPEPKWPEGYVDGKPPPPKPVVQPTPSVVIINHYPTVQPVPVERPSNLSRDVDGFLSEGRNRG